MEGSERLLTGFLPEEVLNPGHAREWHDMNALYERERELLYGALFLCGRIAGTTYRAPLLWYPAEIKGKEGSFRLALDLSAWRLNHALCDQLSLPPETLSALYELIGGGTLDEDCFSRLRPLLRPEGIDTEALLHWPQLRTSRELSAAAKSPKLSLQPAASLQLVERSPAMRGILHELRELEKTDPSEWSPALRAFLDPTQVPDGTGSARPDAIHHIPAILNDSQEKLLRSARSAPLTVCHGPPGTGKTFTIAAAALDHANRSQSTLVIARNDHAADLVQAKIAQLTGHGQSCVRAGRRHYLRELLATLAAHLRGENTPSQLQPKTQERELASTLKELARLEKSFHRALALHLSLGQLEHASHPAFFQKIQRQWQRWRLGSHPTLTRLASELDGLDTRRLDLLRELSDLASQDRLHHLLHQPQRRAELQAFEKALRKRRSGDQEKALSALNFRTLTRAFPIWVCKNDDLHRVLPNTRELFDLVIIDEASQCDLASLLPALQRAKRLLIAGDTQQLRHVSFLPEQVLRSSARQCQLPEATTEHFHYRRRSAMDLAVDAVQAQSQTAFLHEHFRSRPALIAFSKKEFYRDQLVLMRAAAPASAPHPLTSRFCEGERDASGVNQAEIDALLHELRLLLPSWRAEEKAPGIGLLSPLRSQTDALAEALRQQLPPADFHFLSSDCQLRLGTAHAFQGAECDHLFISFALGRNCPDATRRFIERPDVFNVSITRARERLSVFHSVRPDDLPAKSLLARYLTSLARPASASAASSEKLSDPFARSVAAELRPLGHTVRPGPVIAGEKIDLLIEKNGARLGLDLVAGSGPLAPALGLKHQRLLHRAGLRVLPLSYPDWLHRRHECLALLNPLR
ncbi:MAG: DEAD/DEAH box helicase [Verrucomicrobiales bacterium]